MATWYSNQYTNQTSVLRSGEPGMPRFFEGTTTAATGTAYLIKLPPGKIRVIGRLSGFIIANAATANVSLGHAAYTATNGANVAANTVHFMAASLLNTCDNIINASAAFDAVANGGALFDSLTGVDVTATVTDANAAAGAFSGWVYFTKV